MKDSGVNFEIGNGKLTEIEHTTVFLCVFDDFEKDALFKSFDKMADGRLSEQAKRRKFKGSFLQTLSVQEVGESIETLVLVGAGAKGSFAPHASKDLSGLAHRVSRNLGEKDPAFIPALPSGKVVFEVAKYTALGVLAGGYRFDKYKKEAKDEKKRDLNTFTLFGYRSTSQSKTETSAKKKLSQGIAAGQAVGKAVCHARDMVNEPAAAMAPADVAERAKAIAKSSSQLSVKILKSQECKKLGMNMFLAVGQGSDKESMLVHMVYKPKKKAKKRIALIGKGVTFDSGGYSLKPSSAMEDMKIDMAGSAVAVSVMQALPLLDCKYEVHAIAACCENLVSGSAYKLGDVLNAMDGTTVEINNTDAEGRLTLGDAISYTRKKVTPDEIFDFATLTGACMVALGPYTAALFSNDKGMAKRFKGAAEISGESIWQLPLQKRLKEQLKSSIADFRNTGERWGGSITAALFLSNFIKDSPWVHLDLAGPASANRTRGSVVKGGTGFAVSSMCEYLSM